MSLMEIAARIAAPRKKAPLEEPPEEPLEDPGEQTESILQPKTEYACQIELSLSASFEGATSKTKLLKKIKKELEVAIKNGLTTVARDLELDPISALVKPVKIDCAINDQASFDME